MVFKLQEFKKLTHARNLEINFQVKFGDKGGKDVLENNTFRLLQAKN